MMPEVWQLIWLLSSILLILAVACAVVWLEDVRERKKLDATARHLYKQPTQTKEFPMTEENTQTTAADHLQEREEQYLENRVTCNAFVRGLVQANSLVGKYPAAVVSFKHEGVTVRNPFWSIHGEDSEVDPFEYYGAAFTASKFVTLALAAVEKYPSEMDPDVAQILTEMPHTVINVYGGKVERV